MEDGLVDFELHARLALVDFDGLCGDGGRDLNEAHAGRGVEVEVDAGAGARVEDDAASAAVLMEDDFGFGGEHPGLYGSNKLHHKNQCNPKLCS